MDANVRSASDRLQFRVPACRPHLQGSLAPTYPGPLAAPVGLLGYERARATLGPQAEASNGVPKYSPEIQRHLDDGLVDRLPVTFSVYSLDRIRDWNKLFPAEQGYFERLFGLLARSTDESVDQLFAPLREVERKMNVGDGIWRSKRFTLEHVDFLQRSKHLKEWREAVAAAFTRIDPLLDAEVARSGNPRLVVVVSPSELPMGPDRMWTRVRDQGTTVSLKVDETAGLDDYLAKLLTGAPRVRRAPSLFDLYAEERAKHPFDAWVVEANDPILRLAQSFEGWVGLSYARLADLRRVLMREVNELVTQDKIPGPRQLGERLQKMNPGALRRAAGRDPVMQEFLHSVLLNGNGTLLINNTFVEWASLQAIRRARPSLLVCSFGIRNKVKPFSSLLIYSDQEETNPIPTQADMLGSYVDLEVFYQYLWQECAKYAEYRRNTAYLFVGVGMDALFVIAPQDFPLLTSSRPQELEEVFRICANWLGLELPGTG